jgi:hypothetical protein
VVLEMFVGGRRTKSGAASCFLSCQEALSLSLQRVDGRSVTSGHGGGANSSRWRSHGSGSEDCDDGGDGELHVDDRGGCGGVFGTKEGR